MAYGGFAIIEVAAAFASVNHPNPLLWGSLLIIGFSSMMIAAGRVIVKLNREAKQ